MSACRCAVFVCAVVFVASVASGSENDPGPDEAGVVTARLASASEIAPQRGVSSAAAVVTGAAARGPILHPALSERLRAKLHHAIPIARKRLRDYPSCGALFARFGADGVVKLDGTSYFPAGRKQEGKYCRRYSHAFTEVGGSNVVLCRSFAHLSDQQAAIILIHEALHFAGQTESPVDPDAPDAIAITKMVMQGCWLF
jgi:hypothetical protein